MALDRVSPPGPEEWTAPAVFGSPPKEVEPPTVRPEVSPRRVSLAAKQLADLMAAAPRVEAADTAPERRIRAKYGWDGGHTTLEYPIACRPRLTYVSELDAAKNLVAADARIPPLIPPPSIQSTHACLMYHRARAETIREILVEVTAAYNIATGGPTLNLPVPPVQREVSPVLFRNMLHSESPEY